MEAEVPVTPCTGLLRRPYMIHRSPEDDKVMIAIQDAVAKLTAEGKPLFNTDATSPVLKP